MSTALAVDERVVYTFRKGDRAEIRAVLRSHNGYDLAELRAFYQDRDTGEWKPSRRGVTVPQEPEALAELVKAAQALEAEVQGA